MVLQVLPLAQLDAWLAQEHHPEGNELRLTLSPHATRRLHSLARPAAVRLLAGPEGGFSEQEIAAAQRAGFAAIKLGPRVLRAPRPLRSRRWPRCRRCGEISESRER